MRCECLSRLVDRTLARRPSAALAARDDRVALAEPGEDVLEGRLRHGRGRLDPVQDGVAGAAEPRWASATV